MIKLADVHAAEAVHHSSVAIGSVWKGKLNITSNHSVMLAVRDGWVRLTNGDFFPRTAYPVLANAVELDATLQLKPIAR